MNNGPPYTFLQKLSICLRWNFSKQRANLYKYPCSRNDLIDIGEQAINALESLVKVVVYVALIVTWPIRPIIMFLQGLFYAFGNSAQWHCQLEVLEGIMRRRKEKEPVECATSQDA